MFLHFACHGHDEPFLQHSLSIIDFEALNTTLKSNSIELLSLSAWTEYFSLFFPDRLDLTALNNTFKH